MIDCYSKIKNHSFNGVIFFTKCCKWLQIAEYICIMMGSVKLLLNSLKNINFTIVFS